MHLTPLLQHGDVLVREAAANALGCSKEGKANALRALAARVVFRLGVLVLVGAPQNFGFPDGFPQNCIFPLGFLKIAGSPADFPSTPQKWAPSACALTSLRVLRESLTGHYVSICSHFCPWDEKSKWRLRACYPRAVFEAVFDGGDTRGSNLFVSKIR